MKTKMSLASVAFAAVSILTELSIPSTFGISLQQDYVKARNIRLELGHDTAMPLYEELLCKNPTDVTAATRIAANPNSPDLHDKACCSTDKIKIHKLQQLLQDSHYNHDNVRQLFGITETNQLAFCAGPVYLTPASAGGDRRSRINPDDPTSSLQCLVSLFLLGLSVHIDLLINCLSGGKDSVQLLQDLGLAFPCEIDPTLLVPYVHLFPMSVCDSNLVLATDLHPRVLSTTTVGTNQDGTVMYIGPDSLALVRNLPMSLRDSARILDLCSGSGVQALAALKRMHDNDNSGHKAWALCVDVNQRALRFVEFNAILNGLDDQVDTLQTDLVAESTTVLVDMLKQHFDTDGESKNFDLILANPPFIPVPPDDGIIQQRYGLFSSGGADGEDVLKAVVHLASKLLTADGGLLGVVSEFMNPTSVKQRLLEWWSADVMTGVLLTNEFAVDAETYSARRADTREENRVWMRHLMKLNVTHVSPGLLFIETDKSLQGVELKHILVPKTMEGSLWTPSNRKAVEYTKHVLQTVLQYNVVK